MQPQSAVHTSPTDNSSPQIARWSLGLLLAVNLLNYVDRQVLSAVVAKVQEEFQCSDAAAGWLSTAFMVSYMSFALLFGWLADRFSRWALIGIGVILWSLASGASGLATTYIMMLSTRVFVGIGEAAYGPVAPDIISDLFSVQRRGRVLAWFYAAIPVGSALGYVLGGQVLKLGYTWHWAFLVVVPPGLLLGLICLFMRDPPRSVRKRASLADYRKLAAIPSYWFNTAGMTAMTFALGGIAFWMPKYIVWHTQGEISLETANFWFGPIVVVSGLSATLAGGWTGDRLRSRWPGAYFLVSGIAMVAGFPLFLLLTLTPFPAAWGLIFVACFCVFFCTGPTNTIIANVTDPSIRAAAFALNILIIHALGDVISPPLIGWVNDSFNGNMNAGFVAVSFAVLVSGVCWLLGARHLDRDTQRAAQMP
jgi:MFS family permease